MKAASLGFSPDLLAKLPSAPLEGPGLAPYGRAARFPEVSAGGHARIFRGKRRAIRPRLLSAPYHIHTCADEFVTVPEAAGRDRLSRELLQVRRQDDAIHVRIIGQGRTTGKVFGRLASEAALV